MPNTEQTSAEILTPTVTSSSSLSRGKSGSTEKASSSSVRTTKQSPHERPASSSSKPKGAGARSHREREREDPRSSQRYIINPHLFQMSKSVMASPTMMHWSRAPVSGMLPTRHLRAHSMTLVDSTIWIFGGSDETDSRDDVYTLDTETFVWGKPKPTGEQPPGSRAHTATLVHNRFIFIVGGGQDHVYFDTVYIFDTLMHKWIKPDIQGEKPMPRRAHTACLHNGRLFIFGGGNGTVALNDVWTMDVRVPFDKLRWQQIRPREGSAVPPPRGYHTSNLVGNVMVIIGGSDGRDTYDDIWVMDLDTGLWKQVLTDDRYPCMFHSSTQVGSYLFILGGHNGQVFLSDLILFNLVTLQYETKQCAGRTFPARGYHSAVLADSRLVVTGGFDGEAVFDDVSILDLAALAYLPQVTRFGIIIDERGVYVEDEAPLSVLKTLQGNGGTRNRETPSLNFKYFQEHYWEEYGKVILRNPTHPEPRFDSEQRFIQNTIHESTCSEFAIATGGLGDVFSATLLTGKKVGVKCLRFQPDIDQSEESQAQLKRAAHELYVWSKCKHPNILPLLGLAKFRGRIAMVSPWMENGNLSQFLADRTDVDRYKMCVQIAEAVSFLHDAKLVHGDIKALNILVTKDHRPQLTDFGSASLTEYTLKFSTTTYVASTSLRWTAPEILLEVSSRGLSCQGDVYALGMEVITGMVPYAGLSDLTVLRKIQSCEPPDRPGVCPDWFWSLISSCWLDADNRPTASTVRSHMKAHLFCNKLQSASPTLDPISTSSSKPSEWTISDDGYIVGTKVEESELRRRDQEISYIERRGCPNLTRELEPSALPEYPTASGKKNDVFCAKLDTGVIVALKLHRNKDEINKWYSRIQEIHIWSQCRHPNVLDLIGVSKFRLGIAIVTAWMKYGSMKDFLAYHPGENRCKLSLGIAAGVAHLHSIRIVHGCIEADNVLISKDRTPKLAGFGSAIESKEVTQASQRGELDQYISGQDFGDSPDPECMGISNSVYPNDASYASGFETDIASLGIVGPSFTDKHSQLTITILQEAFVGSLAYLHLDEASLHQRVFQFKRRIPERPQQMIPLVPEADQLWRLLEACWSRNPSDCPTAVDVYNEMSSINTQYHTWSKQGKGNIAHSDSTTWSELSSAIDDNPRWLRLEDPGDKMVDEITKRLEQSGCANVTDHIEVSKLNPYPQEAGGFGYIYRETLYNSDIVGIKCPKLHFGSPAIRRKQLTASNSENLIEGHFLILSLKNTAHEAHIWSKCNHPNVSHLIGVAKYRDRLATVSPWMDNGDLVRYLLWNGDKINRMELCSQIAAGVKYLHKEDIVHGDIKGVNILISSDGSPKITDFGSAISSKYSEFQPEYYGRHLAGSLRWMPPERLTSVSPPTPQADIYALAMLPRKRLPPYL
ncbi:Kelch motif [Rhizoctonia solani]|uniref:Kelch motif n=1 Tax=Rhizoctonia solani TaxID=456999 RepID=A0A8H7H2M1_9AGAM|nr:Kelch motif [Rhizoctonia solani]